MVTDTYAKSPNTHNIAYEMQGHILGRKTEVSDSRTSMFLDDGIRLLASVCSLAHLAKYSQSQGTFPCVCTPSPVMSSTTMPTPPCSQHQQQRPTDSTEVFLSS